MLVANVKRIQLINDISVVSYEGIEFEHPELENLLRHNTPVDISVIKDVMLTGDNDD